MSYLYLLWIPYTFVVILYIYSFIKHYRDYDHDFVPRPYHSPKIIFQIMTKGLNAGLVQENIDIINETNRKLNYHNFEIHVVTDGEEKYAGCVTVNVPDDYACEHAVHKSRALQYAVGYRNEKYSDIKNLWILHLDEESRVTDNVVMACINFIEENPDKLIAEGAINYPIRFFDTQYLIPSLIDADRAFSCYFCCLQMKDTPIWLHGSNLLVRADLESEIGWDYKTIAEDARFAYNAEKLKGQVFGWHHGTLLEQPPFTIMDVFIQRRRWFYGTLQNFKYLTWKKKIIQGLFMGVWKTGFIISLLGIPAFLGYIYIPDWMRPLMVFNLLFWMFTYQWGTWLNTKHIDMSYMKRLGLHLYCLVVTPVLAVVATGITIYTLLSRPKGFDIIKKS